ncbi:uncharacterized protein LOC131580759 [Poecile atricapillus]|uniref:uncharacterized protein LOC131580759 n=1 Tax=Poecile atricapillus TaxID=48891 RepID=UPI002739BE09|nr:uncharacterized protein LOC131580759 [Poecile atricapillus]
MYLPETASMLQGESPGSIHHAAEPCAAQRETEAPRSPALAQFPDPPSAPKAASSPKGQSPKERSLHPQLLSSTGNEGGFQRLALHHEANAGQTDMLNFLCQDGSRTCPEGAVASEKPMQEQLYPEGLQPVGNPAHMGAGENFEEEGARPVDRASPSATGRGWAASAGAQRGALQPVETPGGVVFWIIKTFGRQLPRLQQAGFCPAALPGEGATTSLRTRDRSWGFGHLLQLLSGLGGAIQKMTAPKTVITILSVMLAVAQTKGWIVPQPKQNVWMMLAKSLQREELCLSTGAAGNPMTTCLVGIPLKPEEFPDSLTTLLHDANQGRPAQRVVRSAPAYKIRRPAKNPLLLWRDWQATLEKATVEPQEFDLLDSSPASFCVHFRYYPSDPAPYPKVVQVNKQFQAAKWCQNIAHVKMPSTLHPTPLRLPKGLFLICGDRAWAGIPSRLLGGPCTLGRLSLFSPNTTQIENWSQKNNSVIKKRSLDDLDPDCDSEIFHWSKLKRVAVSVFLPWLAAAQALGELGQFECWVVKQANLTSAALSDLLEDEEITRQATLQNRAAIDYLLLLHNHDCREFEGLCCMNLTSKSPSIRQTIEQMRGMVHQIKQEHEDWATNIFSHWGLSGWLSSILKTVLWIIFIIFIILVAFAILRRCLIQSVLHLVSPPPQVNFVDAPSPPSSSPPPSPSLKDWFPEPSAPPADATSSF